MLKPYKDRRKRITRTGLQTHQILLKIPLLQIQEMEPNPKVRWLILSVINLLCPYFIKNWKDLNYTISNLMYLTNGMPYLSIPPHSRYTRHESLLSRDAFRGMHEKIISSLCKCQNVLTQTWIMCDTVHIAYMVCHRCGLILMVMPCGM